MLTLNVLTVSAVIVCLAAWGDTPLHDFSDLAVWEGHADGGNPPEISLDREVEAGSGLRIRYADRPPHWGNLVGACRVPADARALRFRVYKHAAADRAALHIWLREPDGDMWVQKVPFDGRELWQLPAGPHEVRMPVAAFRFDGRGPGTREMTAADRMLIGSNFGDLEVTVADMRWETGTGGEVLALPTTDGLQVERGERGSVGILDMGAGLPDEFITAHPPQALAQAVREAGFGATILQAGDLANPGVLTREGFDAVILPFGPYFPQEAREAFTAYLRAGGSFLSTDGYALDELVILTDAGWSALGPERTAAEMATPEEPPAGGGLNARIGRSGDQMTLEPGQIGVFDPQFHLEHATWLGLAGWYGRPADLGEGFLRDHAEQLLPAPRYELDAPVSGFSSCGLVGLNGAVFPPVFRRWVPVLEARHGAEGALRGHALAVMHNYAGEYPGSSWAFSGITSGADIFLGDASRRALLARVLVDITEKVFLHELTSDFASYEPGETARITVRVSNYGARPARRQLSLEVADAPVLERTVDLAPGETQTVEAEVAVDELHVDLIPVVAVLIEGSRLADRMEAAFCIRDEAVLASGPRIGWEDNYLTVDGRPTFLIGTNQTGMMYFSANENPAVWDRDFRTMAAHNVHILRILHFSPFSKGGYEGRPTNNPLDLAERPERLVRQMDAIVQLAQKHRVAIHLSLHDWMGVTLTDEELAAQADWNRFWAARYRDVPGIFWDIQNEPTVRAVDRPDIVALWNEFLRERHGDDEALRAAWTRRPPEAPLPNVPLGETGEDWDDVRSADRKRFETVLLDRWIKANMEGIRAGDPDGPVCVGYLPSMPPADKILGVAHTDFSNMHYYGEVEAFPQRFMITDRRFTGKGLSIGECGAQEAHRARVNGSFAVPVEASIRRFDAYIHYAPALGGAFLCNWDWKDFDEMVFPWGLMRHSANIPKPWLHTWTQGSLLVSLAEPAYEHPEAFILAPDSHRIGPRFNDLHGALYRAIELMLDQRVNFGMVNEEDIGRLPASARALIWPLPYCPDDETFAAVLEWVRGGGTLYLSGEVAFDAARRPTRIARRAALGLPEAAPVSPFDAPEAAWDDPLVETAVGAGRVIFAPYPLELRRRDGDAQVYRRVIEAAGLSPTPLEPADAPVRALSVPTRDGGRLFMLARTTDRASGRPGEQDLIAVSLPLAQAGAPAGAPTVTVELDGRGLAFVLVGPNGEVLAVESQGALTVGGDLLARAEGHYGLAALDGRDLRETRQLMVLPHHCASVDLASHEGLAGARVAVGVTAALSDTVTAPPTGSFAPGVLAFPPGELGRIAVISPTGAMPAALEALGKHLQVRF